MSCDVSDKTFPGRVVFDALFLQWGKQYWWPGRTRMEIVVGAILTQNTAWTNVEKAISRLKRERALRAERLLSVSSVELAEWIRPAGYFNVKAKRIKAFALMLDLRFGGSLNRLFAVETEELREILLGVNGIGPETADCILLYAGQHCRFVVDAYTRRFLLRHGWIDDGWTYDEVASLFTTTVSADVQIYNEYHALIVKLGKECCRARAPKCDECPLRNWL